MWRRHGCRAIFSAAWHRVAARRGLYPSLPCATAKLEITPSIQRHLDTLLKRHMELEKKLSTVEVGTLAPQEYVQLSKDAAQYSQLAEVYNERAELLKEIEDLERLAAESKDDEELQSLALEELGEKSALVSEANTKLLHALAPKDDADEKSALLEIRAGSGGLEASLFVQDLLSMYQHHAKRNGWRFEVMNKSDTDAGGLREVVANMTGMGVYGQLKYESGTHRVQRVPATESQGRIHTSTVTVALLPHATEVDVELNEKDLRIDTFRSGGAGGQHVNTTDSAVRITHIPTGVVVSMQDERSQHKNKAKALQVLRSRIYEAERLRIQQERAVQRNQQIGTGDRSERIRTYNFAQDRVTDHRINKTHFGLGDVMNGTALDEFVSELHTHYELLALADLS